MLLTLLTAINTFVLLLLGTFLIHSYIRVKRTLRKIIMDCDSIIDQLLEDESPPAEDAVVEDHTPQRSRLAAIVAGGRAKEYLGRNVTLAEIDSMSDDDVAMLYGRYEARLGAAMTKTLGSAFVTLFTSAACMFLPIPSKDRENLACDLEKDPFVDHAVSTACCELYHKYGMYLAPITAALTTAKYCQFEASGRTAHNENHGGTSGGDSPSDHFDATH